MRGLFFKFMAFSWCLRLALISVGMNWVAKVVVDRLVYRIDLLECSVLSPVATYVVRIIVLALGGVFDRP